jgi:hypothetical protein
MDRLVNDQGFVHQFAEARNVHFLEETAVNRSDPADGAFVDEALNGARPSSEAKCLRDHDLPSGAFARLDDRSRFTEGRSERLLDEAMKAGLKGFYRNRRVCLWWYDDECGIRVTAHQRFAQRGKSALSGERDRIRNAVERLVVEVGQRLELGPPGLG